eukprot:3608592-Rhodomonas_salina.1
MSSADLLTCCMMLRRSTTTSAVQCLVLTYCMMLCRRTMTKNVTLTPTEANLLRQMQANRYLDYTP